MADERAPIWRHGSGEPTREGSGGVSRRSLIQGSVAGLALLSASGTSAWPDGACEDLLIFKEDNLRRSMGALFALLRKDDEIRRQFFEDPTRVIIAAILPKGAEMPPEQQISEGNRLLFSLLANDGFRQWASEFQTKLSADIESGLLVPGEIDKKVLYEEVAKAFVEYGDKNLIASLAVQPDKPPVCSVTHVSTCIEISVVVAALLIAVITMIDLTPIAEPRSRLSPMELRSIADQLVLHAKELDHAGTLRDVSATIP
jgi:hypothetical protein